MAPASGPSGGGGGGGETAAASPVAASRALLLRRGLSLLGGFTADVHGFLDTLEPLCGALGLSQADANRREDNQRRGSAGGATAQTEHDAVAVAITAEEVARRARKVCAFRGGSRTR
eukprot:361064-Chlamydomonas_euryale.AAC.3